jgi:hypothetical protein
VRFDSAGRKRDGMTGTRPTTYDEMLTRLELAFSGAEDSNRSFHPRPTDVIIATFSKSGTTWLQQIVHQLRTGGDMDFEDIYEVVPWIDLGIALDLDLDADQRAEPRAFKSHKSWDEVPKGCRYVVSFRDPKDAMVSLYRFLEGWFFEPGSISLDEFTERRTANHYGDGPDYWKHLCSWLGQRDNPDVLLLTFETMKRDLRGAVERVAGFLDIDDHERIEIATRYSSFRFMSANKAPFAEPWFRAYSERAANLPPGSDTSKVRVGAVGYAKQELSEAATETLDRMWAEAITAHYGYDSYRDLAHDIG